jgi:hypothetical protein
MERTLHTPTKNDTRKILSKYNGENTENIPKWNLLLLLFNVLSSMIYSTQKIQSVLGINNKNFLINFPFDLRKDVDSILWSSNVKAATV